MAPITWFRPDVREAAHAYVAHFHREHDRMPDREDMFVAGAFWCVEAVERGIAVDE